ncbi:MAG TPA: hypothetical protein VNM90_05495 [Haliangium sp.]|nr:hypothetical protein [Haliangium sp.]
MKHAWLTRRPNLASCAGAGRRGARARLALAWLLGCAVTGMGACQGSGSRSAPKGEGATGPAVPAEVAVVALEDVAGLSGAATDARGVLWMVPERRHVLIEQAAGAPARAWPLSGVPDEGLDLESLAWLGTIEGRERFAVGTEGVCERNTHAVLVVERQGEGFAVVETIRLPLDLWPEIVCEDGHGLEGLCAAGGTQPGEAAGEAPGEGYIVAAIEHPEQDAEQRRWAPLGVRGPDGRWTPHRVALTSETGKISALDCRLMDAGQGIEGIEVWAIERHFETSRLVRFVVPRDGAAGPITPVVVMDLTRYTDGGRRNFEGLIVTGDRVRVLVDNQWRTISGPNEILSLPLPAQP